MKLQKDTRGLAPVIIVVLVVVILGVVGFVGWRVKESGSTKKNLSTGTSSNNAKPNGSEKSTLKVATDGVMYTDPEGRYTMRYSSEWVDATKTPGTKFWYSNPTSSIGVNVAIHEGLRALSKQEIAQWGKEISEYNKNFKNVELIRSNLIDEGNLEKGQILYEFEWRAEDSTGPYHFYEIVSDGDKYDAFVKFTTTNEQNFANEYEKVRQYMLTLKSQ